jgi:hypothetical protein
MRFLRRLVPEIGFLTLAGVAWSHRGTVVRLVDLAMDTPRLVRERDSETLVQHGRLLYELDRAMPTEMRDRLSGVDHGSVTLAGDPGPQALARATEVLCGTHGITDVRTDGSTHPVAVA